ncbi:hypothetical protein P692DRAFT_20229927 [Suillus brevipes Sb2]|nr:hypothetical protein P692DRAFT_20229927 [Suillus brevipes Sb2]
MFSMTSEHTFPVVWCQSRLLHRRVLCKLPLQAFSPSILAKGFVLRVAVFVPRSTQILLVSRWGNHFQIQYTVTCYKVADGEAKGPNVLITITKI